MQHVQELAEVHDDRAVRNSDQLLHRVLLLLQELGDPLVEVALDLFSQLLVLYGLDPGVGERLPADVVDIDVDHARSGHSGGRGHVQVLHLEYEPHLRRQVDTVSVQQGQDLVVVQDGVHGLDPEGIDRSVQDHPALVVGLLLAQSSHHTGQDPLVPLHLVDEPVQLVHGDGLRVQHLVLDGRVLQGLGLVEFVERFGEDLPASTLAREGLPHQHVAVPGHLGIVQLDDLLDEHLVDLEAREFEFLLDGVPEHLVDAVLQLDFREQVTEKSVEEGDVLGHELRDVLLVDGVH